MMEWYFALALMLGLVCLCMFMGLWVAFAFFIANIVGTYIFSGGEIGLVLMPFEFMRSVGSYTLVPISLFLLMGEILFHTGVAFRAIDAIDRLISRVPGRLAVVTVAGGTVFSSLSGSTIANTAILGSVLLPNMIQRGYRPTLAMGPIMAVGGIAMLVPPSALAVLLASLAEKSISKLLIAGLLPGILMAGLFVGYIVVRCLLDPSIAPRSPVKSMTFRERWGPFLLYVVPLFAIFAVVVGSLFFKLASPTEAAAFGCVATAIVCACYRSLTWTAVKTALLETGKINTMILFIIAGSLTFSQILAVSGATNGLLETVTALDLSVLGAVVVMMLVLLFLGAFMDQVSMILLTLPFFLPFALTLGIDAIWLLLLILIVMEISLLTPPFGLLLFVMRGVAPEGTRITEVYAAAVPFIILELVVLALLIAFPDVALWLPNLLR